MDSCQARATQDGYRCERCRIAWDRDDTAPPCPRVKASPSVVPSLETLLRAASVSCTGLDITIACEDHDVKDALMDKLTGVAFVSALAPRRV